MRIALVEDEEFYSKTFTEACRRYAEEKQTSIQVVCFENPVDFLEKYTGMFDVVFMDIRMPLMDGLTCARKLREIDEHVILCFVTNMANYAIHGYEVGALDFIIKPITYDELAMKLDRILRLLNRRVPASFLISSRTSLHKVDMQDLYCVEVFNHSLVYHTAGGDFEAYGKLSALEEDPRFRQFLKVSPSHLVNAHHVSSVEGDVLIVHGMRVPLSRRRRKECMEKLAAILGGEV